MSNEKINQVLSSINQVIIGKEDKVKLCLAAWLMGGYILLEDIPETGKAVLAKAFAKISQVQFGRVQFTRRHVMAIFRTYPKIN